MKLPLLALLLFTGIYNASAQVSFGNSGALPVVGEYPQNNIKYNEITSGTPFFQDEWVKGKLLARDGMVYNNLSIKLNLLDDRIHFRDENGKEAMIKTALSQIELQPNSKGKTYLFINGSLLPGSKDGWHQVLVNDSITLLKSFNKKLAEHTSYGSPTEYSIETKEKYSVVYNKQMLEVKKPSDLVQVLPAKKAEIEAHIKSINKLSKEEQLISTATFMNTIR